MDLVVFVPDAENQSPNVPDGNNADADVQAVEVGDAKRALQQVATNYTRKEVVSWMVEDAIVNGKAKVVSRTVRAFPEHFRGNEKANLQKASRWWKERDRFMAADVDVSGRKVPTHTQPFKRARSQQKAASGRGRKRAEWVNWLYAEVLEEFHRLRAAGVKFSAILLGEIARSILSKSKSEFNHMTVDPRDGQLIMSKISSRWVQAFMENNNIVLLTQRGRLNCSDEKERQIRMLTAHHLGVLNRGFASGEFHEDFIENIDEIHFVINRDNGHTLGFCGDEAVKYDDVISGGESITLIIRITGGRRARIQTPMLVFTNANRSYPIQGVPDDVPGACYRSSPKGWVDKIVFPQYFDEPRAYQPDPQARLKHVWVDNCTGHNESKLLTQVLARKNTSLRYFPPCTTHLCQPAETLVVSKIKDAWNARWDAKKKELIQSGQWQNKPRADASCSGKLLNPGKHYFLSLASECVADVNAEVDCNGMSYARKSMIRCGLSLNEHGLWSIQQLSPELQAIVEEHRAQFEGEMVPGM